MENNGVSVVSGDVCDRCSALQADIRSHTDQALFTDCPHHIWTLVLIMTSTGTFNSQ